MKLKDTITKFQEHGLGLLERVSKIKDERVRRRFHNRIDYNAGAASKSLQSVADLEQQLDAYEADNSNAPKKKGKSSGKA